MLIDWDMCVWLENKEEAEKIGQKIVRDTRYLAPCHSDSLLRAGNLGLHILRLTHRTRETPTSPSR